MGEIALRRTQAGIEVTRGTAVAATKKLYGTMTMTTVQDKRFANEERGSFLENFRANNKLVMDGFSFAADYTFEDAPFFNDWCLKGGVTPTVTAATVQNWTFTPDQTADTIGTRTLETGDNDIAWQGAFAACNNMDFSFALDDALRITAGGYVNQWVVQNSGDLTTAFTGFTAGLTDRQVESVMGWQTKLFIDASGGTAGTTQIAGRFITATWSYNNQLNRKFFGDNTAVFSKLGRGKRQVKASVTFEGNRAQQWAQKLAASPQIVRVMFTGTPITGSTGNLPKTAAFDFYGVWNSFVIGARDTNTTFQLDLATLNDVTAGKECAVTIQNAQTTL